MVTLLSESDSDYEAVPDEFLIERERDALDAPDTDSEDGMVDADRKWLYRLPGESSTESPHSSDSDEIDRELRRQVKRHNDAHTHTAPSLTPAPFTTTQP